MTIRLLLVFIRLAAIASTLIALPATTQMRITGYMYSGYDVQYVEFTNVGDAPIDLNRWSFDDDSRMFPRSHSEPSVSCRPASRYV